MATLISVTQNNKDICESAILIDENNNIEEYDIFMFNGDLAKHSVANWAFNSTNNIVIIPNNAINETKVWVDDNYLYKLSPLESNNCVPPIIHKGAVPISQFDFDSLIEGDLYFNSIDYHIEDFNGHFVESDNLFTSFIEHIDKENIEYEEVLVNSNLITFQYLRDEDGYAYQNIEISRAIKSFEIENKGFTINGCYNNDY